MKAGEIHQWKVRTTVRFRTTCPKPTIQVSAINVVPWGFDAFTLMMLPGLKAFLETCRQLFQDWFKIHKNEPISALKGQFPYLTPNRPIKYHM